MPNLAKLLATNLSKYGKAIGVKPCTLIKETPGVRVPGAASAGTQPVLATYAAKGFTESYDDRELDVSLVVATDVKISLLGASIAGGQVPAPNDKVAIAGPDGVVVTYRITGIPERDPVGAIYVCNGRK